MTNKEYCDYTLLLRKKIRVKENLISRLRGSTLKDTPGYGTVSVQNNGSNHPMADTADALMDQEKLLALEKAQLNRMLTVLGIALLELDDPKQIAVLQLFYLEGLNGCEAVRALKMGKTTVYRHRDEGLERMKIPQEELDSAKYWMDFRQIWDGRKTFPRENKKF